MTKEQLHPYIENAKARIRLAGDDVEFLNSAKHDLVVHEMALQSLSLESVRSEALVEPSPEQWQEFYDRVWDSDETNPTLALPRVELQRIGRALIAALQSLARVAEPFDLKKHMSKPEQIIEIDEEGNVHSTELRK